MIDVPDQTTAHAAEDALNALRKGESRVTAEAMDLLLEGVEAGEGGLQVRELQYDDKGLKVGTPGAFEHFYDSIEGYTHEPGIRNVLRVDRYTVKNPPADASSSAYVLDMVVESELVKP